MGEREGAGRGREEPKPIINTDEIVKELKKRKASIQSIVFVCGMFKY